jgi:hypothetical protein
MALLLIINSSMESYIEILDESEKQLKEMAIKLSEHLKLISRLKIEQEMLLTERQELTYKLKKKEDQYNQEIKDTSILLNKIDQLEKGTQSNSGLLSKMLCFFSKPQISSLPPKQVLNTSYLEGNNEVMELLDSSEMYTKEAKKIEEVDMELELERMGIGEIVKKI